MNIISGYGYFKISKWSYCPRYENGINVIFSEIQENDYVFLNLDYFNEFINLLENNNNNNINKFILLTQNSDGSFTDDHLNKIEKYVNKIYAINNISKNDKVITYPIGFRDYTYEFIKSIPLVKYDEKNIFVYMNFKIETNYNKRTECYNSFINKNWITIESGLSLCEFYKSLSLSKYVLSPEGTGIDCHRIYESIYFNSILILKTSLMDDFYETLPVIIVKNWDEINELMLIENYDYYYNKLIKWKNNNPNWINLLFWLK
jgi:hypothetical protein